MQLLHTILHFTNPSCIKLKMFSSVEDFLVSAPLRGFSGALMGCFESVLNHSYFLSLSNRNVLISCFEMLLFAAIWTRVAAGKLFQAIGPAAENPRFCMDDDWHRGTMRQYWSADRKFRRPTTVEAGTQSSCRYEGALWWMHFEKRSRILNLILCVAGSQCRWTRINAATGANFGIRSRRRAAAFRIRWTWSVWTMVMPDNTELQ